MQFTSPELSRGEVYWSLQGLGWTSLIGLLATLYWPYAQTSRNALHFFLNMALAMLATSALRIQGRSIWEAGQANVRRGIVLVFTGLFYGIVVEAVGELIAKLTWEPLEQLGIRILLAESVDYALLLAAWCMFYLGIRSYIEVSETERRIQDAQVCANEARLKALRSQLQPHFLFNSLNAASSLLVAGSPAQASIVIEQLNELLTAMLFHEEEHSTDLATELDYARKYLALQQRRFGDRLVIDIHVEDGLEALAIPRWILIPLLENAFRYGLTADEGHIPIILAIRRKGDACEVVITNPVNSLVWEPGFGTGLKNTRLLIHALYGEKASLTTMRERNLFAATLQFPMTLHEADAARMRKS